MVISSILGEAVNKKSLLYHLMKKTTNGDQIVQKKLDDLITTDSSQTGEAKSYDYKKRKFENFDR